MMALRARARRAAVAALDATGLLNPARRLWLAVTSPGFRRRERDIRANYRAYRQRYRAIFVPGTERAAPAARRVLVVGLSGRVYTAKLESLLAKALQARGYVPVILTDRSFGAVPKYYGVFGLDRLVYFDDFVRAHRSAVKVAEARRLLNGVTSWSAVLGVTYRGVEIGRYAMGRLMVEYRTTEREFPKPDAVGDRLEQVILRAMRAVHAAEAVLEDVRPDLILVGDRAETPMGEVFEAALNRGVDAITWCFTHRNDALSFKRYGREGAESDRYVHPFSLSDASVAWTHRMRWTPERADDVLEMFRSSYRERRWFARKQVHPARLQGRDEIVRELGLDPHKPTAVIFSHIFWDATFTYGGMLFEDYEQWLVETARAAFGNPGLNWIVKLHPQNLVERRGKGTRGEYLEESVIARKVGPLPSHVLLLKPDTDISAISLFESAEYGLTVRGTVGLEGPCFGMTVLTAGRGRYAGHGFTVDPSSRDDYLARVAALERVPRIDAEGIERARRACYTLFMLRTCPLTTFDVVYDPQSTIQPEIALRVGSAKEVEEGEDLAAFAEWAVDMRQADFLRSTPAAPFAMRLEGPA